MEKIFHFQFSVQLSRKIFNMDIFQLKMELWQIMEEVLAVCLLSDVGAKGTPLIQARLKATYQTVIPCHPLVLLVMMGRHIGIMEC